MYEKVIYPNGEGRKIIPAKINLSHNPIQVDATDMYLRLLFVLSEDNVVHMKIALLYLKQDNSLVAYKTYPWSLGLRMFDQHGQETIPEKILESYSTWQHYMQIILCYEKQFLAYGIMIQLYDVLNQSIENAIPELEYCIEKISANKETYLEFINLLNMEENKSQTLENYYEQAELTTKELILKAMYAYYQKAPLSERTLLIIKESGAGEEGEEELEQEELAEEGLIALNPVQEHIYEHFLEVQCPDYSAYKLYNNWILDALSQIEPHSYDNPLRVKDGYLFDGDRKMMLLECAKRLNKYS